MNRPCVPANLSFDLYAGQTLNPGKHDFFPLRVFVCLKALHLIEKRKTFSVGSYFQPISPVRPLYESTYSILENTVYSCLVFKRNITQSFPIYYEPAMIYTTPANSCWCVYHLFRFAESQAGDLV